MYVSLNDIYQLIQAYQVCAV